MKRYRWPKIAIIVGSIIVFSFLVLEAYRENLGMAWRGYQKTYREALTTAAEDEPGDLPFSTYALRMRQVVLPATNKVDRCVTCHVGVEDPRMMDSPNPLKTHPGRILDRHEVERFGCTVCHQGQGRAVSTEAAHGQIEHWLYPLVDLMANEGILPEGNPTISSADLLQSSCYQCHNYPNLFKVSNIGAEALAEGQRVFMDKGCLSCHQINGIGANTGVDISTIGDKPLFEYDFSFFPENLEKTIFNWHYQHLRNPNTVVPGTIMPFNLFAENELQKLVVFVLSLKEDGINPLLKFSREALSGYEAYRAFCAGCHGKEGQGKGMATSLNNDILLSGVSDQFWMAAIEGGREGSRRMPSFTFEETGILPEEIRLVLEFVDTWRREKGVIERDNLDLDTSRVEGDAENGRAIFHEVESCAECHGENGVGTKTAAELNNPDFLGRSSDSYIKATIKSDRMKAKTISHFTDEELDDVIAYMRSW